MCAWRLSTHSPSRYVPGVFPPTHLSSRYVCLASLHPLTLKVCMPGISLPTHPQGICAWGLCIHSPSRYVCLASLYLLILKVCAWHFSSHSPSKLVPLCPPILKECRCTHSCGRNPQRTEPKILQLHAFWMKVRQSCFFRAKKKSFSHSFRSVWTHY